MARPQKGTGEVFPKTGQCDLTPRTCQSRARRGELTELGIPLRRSMGDGPADGQMCVTIPLGWSAREVAPWPVRGKKKTPQAQTALHTCTLHVH